jgi:hypothetical protein
LVHFAAGRPSLFWRGVAGLATGLLLFLLIASVCPALHERCCHRHDQADASAAACVILAFADGIDASTPAEVFIVPVELLVCIRIQGAESPWIAMTARLNPPACGPPAAA